MKLGFPEHLDIYGGVYGSSRVSYNMVIGRIK